MTTLVDPALNDIRAGFAALDAERTDDGFSVTLANDEGVVGRTLLLAYGITDILPKLPGLPERWGQSVIHCPYCNG